MLLSAMRASISAFAGLLSIGCGDDPPSPTQEPVPIIPRTESYVQVVPFENTPAGVVTQDANNNLDIVDHEGRIYFAFRTAPTHFASEHVELYVVSSTDQQSWELEQKIDLDRDIREPRFLSLGGRLWMYYAVLGTSSIDFEPHGTFRIERNADGTWSEPEEVFELGFIPWRIKVYGDTAYMLGYVGGEDIYDFMEGSVETYWLKTTDGTSWEAADGSGGDGIVLVGGSSEADFVFLDDGSIVAVARNELGDASGWGSKICTAPASDLGTWSCKTDKKKYDSPLVFRYGQRVILIGRRNVTETGNYDLDKDELSQSDQTGTYLVEYSFQPKRCAVWEVDPATQTVAHLLDLPSKGDTCFASILDNGPAKPVTVYNYSSDPEREDDPSWIEAQGQPTLIYKVDLLLEEPGPGAE
jgi:hypothetical protein